MLQEINPKKILGTKMKPNFSNIPYDIRNNNNVGKYRGVGLRAKVGEKKGTFTDQPIGYRPVNERHPPRNFN